MIEIYDVCVVVVGELHVLCIIHMCVLVGTYSMALMVYESKSQE
jgi:hypothetical protein